MAAGSIIIDLLMKTGAFETDTERAKKKLREMEKTAKQVGAAIGTALVAAGTGLAVMVKGAIDSADAMRDLSIRVGVSTEVLSAYGYAASQTGTDIETVGKGLKVLAKNMADALNPTSEQAKVFEALGFKVTDARGNLKKLSDAVPELADKFKALENGTTKTALSQALLGKAGLELTEFFNSGSQGLAEYTARMKALGLEIDGNAADAADQFNDTLGDLKKVSEGYALHLAQDLLPDLQQLADGFLNTATEGNKVKEMAQDTADFLRGLAQVVGFVADAFNVGGKLIANNLSMISAALKFAKGDFREAKNLFKEGMEGLAGSVGNLLGAGNGKQQKPPALVFAGEGEDPEGLFAMSPGEAQARAEADKLEAALALALSNPTGTGSKGKAAGKSEAEKEAERLQAAYDGLVASQQEQIALFGQTTEAAKVRYATEHGELAKLPQELKAVAIANAERIDQLEAEADAQQKLDEANQRRHDTVQQLLADIAFEHELMGKSAEDQEILNNLRWAGVDANSAYGQSIIEATKSLQAQREIVQDQIDTMDGLRDSARGFLGDLREGESVWDSLKNAAGRFADKLWEIAANNLIERIFGKQGTTGQGTGGGDFFGNLLGAFTSGGGSGESAGSLFDLFSGSFMGGFAGGGSTMAGHAYLVGEQGPELFVPRTAGAVLPADTTQAMTRGGGYQDNRQFNFLLPRRVDNRTQMQIAQASEVRGRMATRKNS